MTVLGSPTVIPAHAWTPVCDPYHKKVTESRRAWLCMCWCELDPPCMNLSDSTKVSHMGSPQIAQYAPHGTCGIQVSTSGNTFLAVDRLDTFDMKVDKLKQTL